MTSYQNTTGAVGSETHLPRASQPQQSSRTYFLAFCSFLSSLAALSLMFTMFFHLVCIFSFVQITSVQGIVELFYRLYGLVFSTIGVLCEMEWTETIRGTSLLQFWTSRGMFYLFISLFTCREYGALTYQWSEMRYVLGAIAGILSVVGICYVIMGTFCMKRIRDEKMARYLRMLSGYERVGEVNESTSYRPRDYGARQ